MNAFRSAQEWLAYRRTVRELAKLPDDLLEDIGLHRIDIRSAAAKRHR